MIDLALTTARVAVDADIVFPDGLPGFPDAHRFRVRSWPRPDEPFALLVDVDAPDEVAFAVVPATMLAEARLDLLEAAAAHPTLRDLADVVVRCIVTPGHAPTVNLLAPIVVDRATGIARQVALDGPPDAARAPLVLLP
ncbi:MAG TPA: flagellar assembly protein FliW [Acidimicrobiia bacterium]|nr:flagellar assembly protein FliW [Acidimicrobiia bacterium]